MSITAESAGPTNLSFYFLGSVDRSKHIGFICGFRKTSGIKTFLVMPAYSSTGSIGSNMGILMDLPLNS
jgi:hypothetical protein